MARVAGRGLLFLGDVSCDLVPGDRDFLIEAMIPAARLDGDL